MADIIKTNLEQVITGGGGTIRIDDTTEYDDLKILSIIPEAATAFEILTVVGPDGVESSALTSVASGGRNLTDMVAGVSYMAGTNSYFKSIKLTSGAISCNKA